jgi:hypothetical protein
MNGPALIRNVQAVSESSDAAISRHSEICLEPGFCGLSRAGQVADGLGRSLR